MNVMIRIKGAAYRIEVDRMVRLFFPYAHVLFEDESVRADLSIALSIAQERTQVSATSLITVREAIEETELTNQLPASGLDTCFRASHALSHDHDAADSVRRKLAKRAMLYALHETLRALTGRGQPWGVLTGVRPVKLAHEALRSHATAGRVAPSDIAQQARRMRDEFLVDDTRAPLVAEIVERELQAVPDLYALDEEVSIYVGIPFCPTHCAYCTFPAYSMVEKARYAGEFLRALIQEIKLVGRILEEYRVPITTVYIGGGTPTALKAPELAELLQALAEYLPGRDAWREFCVEAGRADTITPDRVAVMATAAVDRVSVNPQTFRAATLKCIGRGHSPDIVDKRFLLFREAGVPNINMDLILGLPGESVDDVQYSVERTLRLQPDSITVHTLSMKRTAQMKRERGAFAIPADETVREMMVTADGMVRASGQLPYYLYRQKDILGNLENIGYSLPGKEGIYNIAIIEEAQTIVALGGGAASKWVMPDTRAIRQHTNPREPSVYVNTIASTLARKEQDLRAVCEAIAAVRGRRIGQRARASAMQSH